MPMLFFHAVIAVATLINGSSRRMHRLIREFAYTRTQMRWAKMCIEPVEIADPSPQVSTARSNNGSH